MIDNPWLAMALNNAWANATLYRAMAGMSDAQFAAARPGFFGSLMRTMNHIYEVDLYYVDALEEGGRGRTVYDRDDIRDVATLGAAQAAVDGRFAGFCRDLTAADLSRRIATERRHGTVTERIDALILHLVQHQVHHRGQAHVMLSHAGIDPPQLDDFYLEDGRVPSAQDYWS